MNPEEPPQPGIPVRLPVVAVDVVAWCPARTARWASSSRARGVPEVDEQAIAEILGDMPLKAGNHFGAGLLIGPHHLAQLLRVELAGEHSRVYQVTQQHGELTAFRVGGARSMCG
jgi:hypothetical protein